MDHILTYLNLRAIVLERRNIYFDWAIFQIMLLIEDVVEFSIWNKHLRD